jgi:hypothetical protein
MAKLNEELLSEVRMINADATRLTSELGVATYRVIQAEAQLEDMKKQQQACIQELDALSARDAAFLAKLRSEHGDVMVNIETGELIPETSPVQQQ